MNEIPKKSGRWSDLGPRLGSGIAMAGGGIFLIWLGGWWFAGLAVIAGGIMVWELAHMLKREGSNGSRALGVLAALALLVALGAREGWPGLGGGVGNFGWGWGGVLIALPAIIALTLPMRDRAIFTVYSILILQAAYGLVTFRADHGMLWLIWLVLVVVASDIGGYFGGRLLGGPKFWPRFSPKKTWAGVLTGWIAAALVGLAFRQFTTAGPDIPWISAALAFASQLGDIAESAIKRRAGVKDSSNLIPGHGGLLDRFDGLLGAAVVMLIVALVVVVPEVRH